MFMVHASSLHDNYWQVYLRTHIGILAQLELEVRTVSVTVHLFPQTKVRQRGRVFLGVLAEMYLSELCSVCHREVKTSSSQQ